MPTRYGTFSRIKYSAMISPPVSRMARNSFLKERDTLEVELHRQLDLARVTGAAVDDAEGVGVVHARARAAQAHPVERVEGLDAELQAAVAHREGPEDREVHRLARRGADRA